MFGSPLVTFLGHTVSARGILLLASKVTAITSMPRPVTQVDLQQYLGCINFYHRFVPRLRSVLAPLHSLISSVTKQKEILSWDPDHIATFVASNTLLMPRCWFTLMLPPRCFSPQTLPMLP